jgi:hypothetical protein
MLDEYGVINNILLLFNQIQEKIHNSLETQTLNASIW